MKLNFQRSRELRRPPARLRSPTSSSPPVGRSPSCGGLQGEGGRPVRNLSAKVKPHDSVNAIGKFVGKKQSVNDCGILNTKIGIKKQNVIDSNTLTTKIGNKKQNLIDGSTITTKIATKQSTKLKQNINDINAVSTKVVDKQTRVETKQPVSVKLKLVTTKAVKSATVKSTTGTTVNQKQSTAVSQKQNKVLANVPKAKLTIATKTVNIDMNSSKKCLQFSSITNSGVKKNIPTIIRTRKVTAKQMKEQNSLKNSKSGVGVSTKFSKQDR